MRKLYWVGRRLELRTVVKVKVAENDQDYEFVMAKGRWHSHDKYKTFCPSNECIVMAVF